MLTHPRQELYKLGILYDGEYASQHNDVKCFVPPVDEQTTPPLYTMRPSRTRCLKHPRRGNRKLQQYLTLSDLSTNNNLAKLLSPNTTPAIQHRDFFSSIVTDIPQSLPPTTSASGSGFLSSSQLHFLSNDTDWTFITHPETKNTTQSPSSEPETWIILSDDS